MSGIEIDSLGNGRGFGNIFISSKNLVLEAGKVSKALP